MIVLEWLAFSGATAAGSRWAHKVITRRPKPRAPELRQADRDLMVASASLGLATAGSLLRAPLLGYASIPAMLFVFTPVFKNAWNKLGKERRINDQVLVATRVTVCVAMGYTFIAALDATLLAVSHRLFERQEASFRRSLQDALRTRGDGGATDLYAALENLPHRSGLQQGMAESNGERMAPWMLASFVLTIPLMGINRAAAFLTTTFGAHLRNLGPYTTQRFVHAAVQEGIVLMRPDALERAAQVDTLVIDGGLLEAAQGAGVRTVIETLRAQYSTQPGDRELKIYALFSATAASGKAQMALGLDDCIQCVNEDGREAWLADLQAAGRKLAYISAAAHGNIGRQGDMLTIACSRTAISTPAQVVLFGDGLRQLPVLFGLAGAFAQRQRFNFIAPIGVDLVDISTTVFLDFGLIYSVLFTYTGLMLGVARNHLGMQRKEVGEMADLRLGSTADS